MKAAVTIKENRDFHRIYSRGRSAVTPFLVMYCRRNNLGRNRLGVTVSTRIGGAVIRNRARRRLREVYRLAQPTMKQGWDIILVARDATAGISYQKLEKAFFKAAGKLDLLAEAQQ